MALSDLKKKKTTPELKLYLPIKNYLSASPWKGLKLNLSKLLQRVEHRDTLTSKC